MATYTVGVLARSVGLARSTLLYYDRIGLLSATRRSAGRYRLYGDEARARLEAICTYRRVGLGLREIRGLLNARDGQTAAILTARLARLNEDIARLREQQRVIVKLLKNRTLLNGTRALDKRRWVQILSAAGLHESDMGRWHVEFEALAPEAHQDFLESLGISRAEVTSIRERSRSGEASATTHVPSKHPRGLGMPRTRGAEVS
jgi:MerR family transcriptional regulator, thiopeptide resistance regulator